MGRPRRRRDRLDAAWVLGLCAAAPACSELEGAPPGELSTPDPFAGPVADDRGLPPLPAPPAPVGGVWTDPEPGRAAPPPGDVAPAPGDPGRGDGGTGDGGVPPDPTPDGDGAADPGPEPAGGDDPAPAPDPDPDADPGPDPPPAPVDGPGPAPLGATCDEHERCGSGHCLQVRRHAANVQVCATACCVETDCPAGFGCIGLGAGRWCVAAALFGDRAGRAGAPGAPCDADGQCASRVCNDARGACERSCWRRCAASCVRPYNPCRMQMGRSSSRTSPQRGHRRFRVRSLVRSPDQTLYRPFPIPA